MRPRDVAQLFRLARQPSVPHYKRRWAGAQLVCIALVWLTGALVLVTVGAQMAGWRPAGWWPAGLALLVSAAVGYATNYMAITMLFEPARPRQPHWLRVATLGLWKQGLIPARRQELGHSIGETVSERLFTPEQLARTLSEALEQALEDPDVRRRMLSELDPMLRDAMPALVSRLSPEMVSLISEAFTDSINRENASQLLERVLEPWLESEESREQLAGTVTQVLARHTPQLVEQLRAVVEQEKRRAWLKRVAFRAAELLNALDWDEIEATIRAQLQSPETRRRLVDGLADAGPRLRAALDEASGFDELVVKIRNRSRAYVREGVQSYLEAHLPAVIDRLLDNEAFWQWLHDEGIPTIRVKLKAWFERSGPRLVSQHIRVSERVQAAIEAMEVEEVGEMVGRIAAEQLGAIQVLGYVLGFFAGIAILLLVM